MATSTLSPWLFLIISVIIILFAVVVLVKIWKGSIGLEGLLNEPDSKKASLSRFQFLIFTFVIAGLFLLLSIENGTFVDVPQNVLILLGISGGSYVAAKSTAPGGLLSRSNQARPSKSFNPDE